MGIGALRRHYPANAKAGGAFDGKANAKATVKAIAACEDVVVLAEAYDVEVAGKARKSVLEAFLARLDELSEVEPEPEAE